MDLSPREPRKLEILTRRLEVLERLCDGPAYKRDLDEELDQSGRTISRALNELEEFELVERGDEGFTATMVGRLALDELGAFQRRIDDFVAAKAVLSPLSTDSPLETEAVAGGEALLANDPVPHRPLERFHDGLAAAERYRAILPELDDPRHVRLLYEHVVTNGRPAELIVTPELLRALRTEFPRRSAAMAECDGFRVFVADVPPFALGLVESGPWADPDTTGYVLVFGETGSGIHGALVNGTPSAIRWAEALYREHRAVADDRTDQLLLDADGGVRTADADEGLIHATIGKSLSIALEREGFVRLGQPYFRAEPVADPTTAWRAGLSLPEVHTGYAIERTLDSETDGDDGAEHRTLSAALVDDLAAGTDCVVLGPPGAGKSTICKRVACEWYDDDRGPVLYRESGRGRPFGSVDDLIVTVDAAAGHTLVVVEDAVRPEAETVFEAIDRLGDREDVSFLLDAREHEWRNPPGDVRDVPDVAVRMMPPLHDADARRLVDHFERTAGERVEVPGERLLESVRSETSAGEEGARGEMLPLLHRLAGHADPLADGQTSLEAAVADVIADLASDEVALDVCVLANVLNAAGGDVDVNALYAVADPDAYDAVDAVLERLEGRVLFPHDDGSYRLVHESWSVTFLEHLLDAEGEDTAAARFGDCVSALLALADDPGRRENIANHRGDRWALPAVADEPSEWADDVTEAVYALGRERPKLAPLFGDGERDSVTLPDSCSECIADRRPVWLGTMFKKGGYFDRAVRAFERLPHDESERARERLLGLAEVAENRGEYEDVKSSAEECLSLCDEGGRQRARAHLLLGLARAGFGDYESADEHYEAALDGFEAAGDRRLIADTLNDIGINAGIRGAYDEAREYFDRSLAIRRDLGDRKGKAASLGNLGLVADHQGAYDEAREYLRASLEIQQALGDRKGASEKLNNLGIIAGIQGDPARAREYHERSLEIKRDLDDRQGVANSLNNAGLVAQQQGDLDAAHEYFERSLETKRDLGDRKGEATSLNNLGKVAKTRGEYDEAREYFERSLEIKRDLEIRQGEATSLDNLGRVAHLEGEYEEAREYFERSLEMRRDLDARDNVATSLGNLGALARAEGDLELAAEHLERALEIARNVENPSEVATNLFRLGDVARERGNHDRARTYVDRALETAEDGGYEREMTRARLVRARVALDAGDAKMAGELAADARDRFAAMGATHLEARSRTLLGRAAAAVDDTETAKEHWETALEVFEQVNAPQDALETLHYLVEATDGRDDEVRTREWCQQAQELLADAPEAVVERHRGRIQRLEVSE
jgi:tetratricopeptide (TPR) repeat protein/predicted transcriptional regulator